MTYAPRLLAQPTEGFYAVKLVRRGPIVPAKLSHINGRWLATVNGEDQGYAYTDEEIKTQIMICLLKGSAFSHPFVRIHAFGERIEETEYLRMLETVAWARGHSPDHPCLHPEEPIVLSTLPSLWSVLCQKQND